MFLKDELCNLPLGCKLVIPTGSVHRIYGMGFKDMISWFNVHSYHVDDEEPMTPAYFREHYCQEDIQESVNVITRILKEEIEILGDSKKVFLGGYS